MKTRIFRLSDKTKNIQSLPKNIEFTVDPKETLFIDGKPQIIIETISIEQQIVNKLKKKLKKKLVELEEL